MIGSGNYYRWDSLERSPIRYSIETSIAPSTPVLSTSDAKGYLRIDHAVEDTLIDSLVEAATQQVQRDTGIQLITATLVWRLDGFPEELIVPIPPAQSVTSITYTDSGGTAGQTLATSVYSFDGDYFPGRIVLKTGQVWPTTDNSINCVIVTYKAGYGDAASAVPAPLVEAVRFKAAEYYEVRDPRHKQSNQDMYIRLIHPYKLMRVA